MSREGASVGKAVSTATPGVVMMSDSDIDASKEGKNMYVVCTVSKNSSHHYTILC